MSFPSAVPVWVESGWISHGVVSSLLMRIGLATSHIIWLLGRPDETEKKEAENLLRSQNTPQQRAQIFELIFSILKQVGALTDGLAYSLKLRLHAGTVSTAEPGKSRVDELFVRLEAWKIIPRSQLTNALGIGDYTLTGYISALRDSYFPKQIFVTADIWILLLSDSDGFMQGTTGLFTEDEQRTPTRVSVFMYLIFKNMWANTPFRMSEVFKQMESIWLPVRKKENLIAHVKKLFGYKWYLLQSDGKWNYTLSKISE